MTVGQKLHQILASLRSAKAEMESFSMETQDKNAQKLYTDSAKQLENMVNSISGRVNYVEQQEPQFQVKKKMQQQNNNQQQ